MYLEEELSSMVGEVKRGNKQNGFRDILNIPLGYICHPRNRKSYKTVFCPKKSFKDNMKLL